MRSGIEPSTLPARLALLDRWCGLFLHAYRQHASVSVERVALWETLDLLGNVLTCWTKLRPHRLEACIQTLHHQLHQIDAAMARSGHHRR
jgi:hypothetical protein